MAFAEVTTFLLIRHGETDWNRKGLLQGQTNVPLNEEGLKQAKLCALVMSREHADISAIYSSDLDRAHITALETACLLDLPVTRDAAFREVCHGSTEGLTNEEKIAKFGKQREALIQKYPDWRERWNFTYIPGAETNVEVQRRFRGALVDLSKKHAGQKVAVFAHGQAICLSLCDGITPTDDKYLKHCEIVQITIDPELGEQSIKCLSAL